MEIKPLARYFGGRDFFLPPHSSTRTRLHELAHFRMGHEPGLLTLEQFISRDIDAELFAWRMMDKSPTIRVGIPVLVDLIDEWDVHPYEACDLVVDELKLNEVLIFRQGVRELRFVAIDTWKRLNQ